jgi:uracil-DNA glycosylase
MHASLQALNNAYHRANRCPLKHTATRPVYGDGSPKATIVFIGEAPGKQEDASGTPFVGASGKLLETLLSSVGLERSDVYITNCVKYRPPDNRDPSHSEKRSCVSWLLAELAYLNPTHVVCLGRHALSIIAPTYSLKEHRMTYITGKQTLLKHTPFVVPFFHPAVALYNPRLRATLLADMQALKMHHDHYHKRIHTTKKSSRKISSHATRHTAQSKGYL